MEQEEKKELSPEKKKLLKTFVIRVIITYVIWLVVYYGWIVPDGRVNAFLTQKVIDGTVVGLNLLGYESSREEDMVLVNQTPVVLVADGCNGLELFALYAGFLICFPGRIGPKMIFIPAGIMVIYIINISREVLLSLNYMYSKESFDFNHKYTYVLVVYVVVFLIWRWWLNKFSGVVR